MIKENLKLNIDEIKINNLNPRIHNARNINMIKNSMKDVGVIDSLIVDENNELLAGHGRLLALKELGEKRVDVLRVSGLSDKQKKAYLIYSNRTTETSFFHDEILLDIANELYDSDIKIANFELDDLNILFSDDTINIDLKESQKVIPKDKDYTQIVGISIFDNTELYNEILEILQRKIDGTSAQLFTGKKSIIK